jgi:hypothetical protein
MRFTGIMIATLAVAITGPVAAQTWSISNYYVVRDGVTARCKVVDIKPTANGVSAGIAYESRALADAALAEAAKYEIPDCGSTR